VEQWRIVPAVQGPKLAVAGLQIEFPDLFSVKIEASKIAGTDLHPDMLAIRARRGRSIVAFIAHEAPHSFAELAPPEFLALGAYAQQDQVFPILASHEQLCAPERRRRTA